MVSVMTEGGRTPLETALESVLHRHGVVGEQHGEMLAELARTARSESWWDDERIKQYVGVGSVRQWTHRHGVNRKMLADADQVKAIRATLPGKGWRGGRT